jgi:hypothetical protein
VLWFKRKVNKWWGPPKIYIFSPDTGPLKSFAFVMEFINAFVKIHKDGTHYLDTDRRVYIIPQVGDNEYIILLDCSCRNGFKPILHEATIKGWIRRVVPWLGKYTLFIALLYLEIICDIYLHLSKNFRLNLSQYKFIKFHFTQHISNYIIIVSVYARAYHLVLERLCFKPIAVVT